jgi:MtN3 and saliva related transmembrane protein
MELSTYIGVAAGICTAISMLPQLIKIIKAHKAEDISLVMLIVLLVGLLLWIWYGIERQDYPIIMTNSFSFLVNALIVFFATKYKNK